MPNPPRPAERPGFSPPTDRLGDLVVGRVGRAVAAAGRPPGGHLGRRSGGRNGWQPSILVGSALVLVERADSGVQATDPGDHAGTLAVVPVRRAEDRRGPSGEGFEPGTPEPEELLDDGRVPQPAGRQHGVSELGIDLVEPGHEVREPPVRDGGIVHLEPARVSRNAILTCCQLGELVTAGSVGWPAADDRQAAVKIRIGQLFALGSSPSSQSAHLTTGPLAAPHAPIVLLLNTWTRRHLPVRALRRTNRPP